MCPRPRKTGRRGQETTLTRVFASKTDVHIARIRMMCLRIDFVYRIKREKSSLANTIYSRVKALHTSTGIYRPLPCLRKSLRLHRSGHN